MPVSSTSAEEPAQRLPHSIERNMNAQSLLPSHRPLLDFFRQSVASFQSASNIPFQVVCTLTSPVRSGPAALLQHRITATATPTPAPVGRGLAPKKLVVLDSSFNPPTLAHLWMARDAVVEELKRTEWKGVRLLLLLAVQNADKAPKPAGFEQRLAMMWAFARDVRSSIDEELKGVDGVARGTNVTIDVGLTTKPFFHEKSEAIARSDFYKEQAVKGEKTEEKEGEEMEQVILAGYDTLIRIFSPKYYGDEGIKRALGPFFDRSRLRLTMRTDAEWGNREEQMGYVNELLRGDGLEKIGGSKEWARRIEIDEKKIGGKAGIVSSTLAREAAKNKDWDRVGQLVPTEVRRWVEREGLYSDDQNP
ncbi:hypothetical protein DL546_000686 [Coniochaeta pulveracea]|uniref:Nicotinamide-nucleotide adenylyltransferase n=1 Tax=Coniochaeta pulveracea TaxID=177199 RepID=A0A420XVZ9_9PEZI|nr:hypothetical protein DL546_000686 [Coniochaeta pulveracea]